MTDFELLREFARNGSQATFREVVRRHVDAVYSAARRQVGHGALAEDVTQAVFILLAKKAGTIDERGPLAGWLIKTTYFACRDAVRAEARRRKHERKAAAMRTEQIASGGGGVTGQGEGAVMVAAKLDASALSPAPDRPVDVEY